MAVLSTFLALLLSLAGPSTALVARASLPPSFSVQALGFTTESDPSYDGVSRDGGGGGLINGYDLIVFSDTETVNSNDQIIGFTSNSVAYMNPSTPTSLTDFGSNGIPNLGIPFTENETEWTNTYSSIGSRMIMWPGSSIAAMTDGVSGVAVYNVAELASSGDATALYNTMVQFTPDASGPQAVRAVPQLFYDGETQYGSFCSAISNIDGNLLLFAKVGVDSFSAGLKVARVNPNSATDRTQYSYWDGTTWSLSPVSPDSTDGNILTNWAGLNSGDLFYNAYLNTWLFVYFDNFADSTFYMRYALEGHVTGNWSDQTTLYVTTPSSKIYNYGAHAYPSYDASGKTLLLSWTYNGGQTEMATVSFA